MEFDFKITIDVDEDKAMQAVGQSCTGEAYTKILQSYLSQILRWGIDEQSHCKLAKIEPIEKEG